VAAKGIHGNEDGLGFLIQLLSPADTHAGLQIRYPLLLFDFNQNGNVLTNFCKLPNTKFRENPFSRSRAAAVETDIMAKLTGALLQLPAANAPTNVYLTGSFVGNYNTFFVFEGNTLPGYESCF
jgi:hypothetical protein